MLSVKLQHIAASMLRSSMRPTTFHWQYAGPKPNRTSEVVAIERLAHEILTTT